MHVKKNIRFPNKLDSPLPLKPFFWNKNSRLKFYETCFTFQILKNKNYEQVLRSTKLYKKM